MWRQIIESEKRRHWKSLNREFFRGLSMTSSPKLLLSNEKRIKLSYGTHYQTNILL